MGSIFKQLLNFSKSLKESIKRQDEAIVLLSTVTADFSEPNDIVYNFSCSNLTVTTRTDVGYVLNKESQSYNISIQRTYPGQNADSSPAVSISVSVGEFPLSDEVIDKVVVDLREVAFTDDIGIGISLYDICTEVVVGQSMNEAVASINDMFLSHTKVSTSDVISLITTIPSIDQSDEKELIQAILSVSSQGVLSNHAWIGALRSILSSGAESTEKGTIVLQTDSAFAVQSFMNTVLQVAQVAFSAILTALATVLYGLLAILAGVVSVILTAFKSFTTDINIDPDSNNEYVQGVFGANTWFTKDLFPINGHVLKSESAIRSVIGPFELFTWVADDSSEAKVNMNLFLNLSFNPVKFMSHILDGVSCTINDTTKLATIKFLSYDFNPYNVESMDDVYSHDTDYLIRLHFDKDALLKQYQMCTIISALSLLQRGGTYTINMDYPINVLEQEPIEKMIACLLYCIATCKSESKSLDEISLTWFPINNFRDYLNDIREHFDSVDSISDIQNSFNVQQQSPHWGFGGQYVNSIMNGVHNCFRPLLQVTGSGLLLRVSEEYWDHLIPPPSVSLPELSTAEVVAAIGLVIAAAGVAFLASRSISRWFKARRQIKLAKRTDVLNSKRNAYLNDPQNKELKKEYMSALISYEKRASLFGWPSYDAVNGRMNVGVQSSTASSLLNEYLNTTDTTEYIASLIK
jgi:hypothetical protein